MNRDFVEMLSALSAERAEFLLVGAHAMAAHGVPRATGDIDLWIHATPDNARKVWRELAHFGAPIGDLTVGDLARTGLVYQIGLPPKRIDVLTSIDGVEFERAWPRRMTAKIEDLEVATLGLEDLIANKRATGRPKDLVDADWLEARRKL